MAERPNGMSVPMVARVPVKLAMLVQKEAKKRRVTKTVVLIDALKEHFRVHDAA